MIPVDEVSLNSFALIISLVLLISLALYLLQQWM